MGFDTWSSTDPALTDLNRMRLLAYNFLYGATFPVLATGRPNPSSQLAWSPVGNIVHPSPNKRWITRGHFTLSSETTKGYEGAPNWKLRVSETSGVAGFVDVDIRSPVATTTSFDDPRILEKHIAATLNADATLAGTYTVDYLDERHDSSFKWRISCSVPFWVDHDDAASLTKSLGFTADLSGASTYTSTNAAIHTEEYFVVQLNAYWKYGSPEVFNDAWRWLALRDFNYNLRTYGLTYSGMWSATPRVQISLGTSAAGVEGVDDASGGAHTLNDNIFFLWGDPGASPAGKAGIYEGTDSDHYVVQDGAGGQLKAWPCRYYLGDLAKWRGTHLGLGSEEVTRLFVKFKIVDPRNPAGHISLANAFMGPGWMPKGNFQKEQIWTPRDRSELLELVGPGYAGHFVPGQRVAELAWARSFLSTLDQTEIDAFFLRPRKYDSTALQPLPFDGSLGAGQHMGVWALDPQYENGTKTLQANAKGLIYGRAQWGKVSESRAGHGTLHHLDQLTVLEDVA